MTRPQTQNCSKPIKDFVHCGAGPRAGQYLVLAAKARAVMHGRLNVSIADVMAVAVPVLRHRIFTNFSADAEGITPFNLVRDLLKFVAEPTVKQENKLEREAKVGESKPIAPPQQKPPPSAETPGIVTHCPACGKTLLAPRKAAGQHARCRHCSEVFPVEQ
jgi:Mg-chelatase subunit ChlI